LGAPFGFKGAYLSELWQTVVKLEDSAGHVGLGLGSQSVLWSDAAVFTSNAEAAGNSQMYLTTAFAAKLALTLDWQTPIELLDKLLPPTYAYAQTVTARPALRLTFALNALVALDNAAWMLYAKANGLRDFDALIPADVRPALAGRQKKLAAIPLVSYGVSLEQIQRLIDEGSFVLKVKIGSDPAKDGDPARMLEWDCQRLSAIHEKVRHLETPHTDSGHIPYYLDANGRYDSKERLLAFLRHAEKIGALDRILLLEEPFPEEFRTDVRDIPARLVADESAHSDRDARERIEMGYGAIALKPIAKTMSMSFKIARIAHEHHVPCFCADLTVNPILVDWNKNVAARLAPLPGMKIGVLESNGHQNYRNWPAMCSYHPRAEAPWTQVHQGVYDTDVDFFRSSGAILEESRHYRELV
jgi:L-alanine-DL-glutamate epimerase-like enolase superfamily enzyme